MADHHLSAPADDDTAEHQELRRLLSERVQRSVTSAAVTGRTVDDPAVAAEYVVDALMEWPDGQALVERVAAHLARRHAGGQR